ncbi:hypothetical protein CcCBS67573_g10382 [Chytriomyces confervae]|uniref:Uncharacterized protein n=1 Tax=Chytriomyces confervae TaxID=246404 RepID=A0A507D0S9_9FUNG|nr:hypothetical protein CcCBS67573_g10382 [Chytriomyces confervae]
MILPVASHLINSHCTFTIVVPCIFASWWVQLRQQASSCLLLGKQGESNVFSGYNTASKSFSPLHNPHDFCNRPDFRYCFKCGEPARTYDILATIEVDETYIQQRSASLLATSPALPFPVVQEMLRFSSFLASRTSRPPIPPLLTTPLDVVEFLIHKELNGRTQYHHISCPHTGSARVGKRVLSSCDKNLCQTRAAPTSLRTAVSLLRSGLADLGLTLPWDPRTGHGNPADSRLVSLHLDRVTKEAADSLVMPLQATPLLLNFLAHIKSYVMARICDNHSPTSIRLMWRQFWCFTTLVGCSGRRPGDLIHLRTPSLTWLPCRSRIIATLVSGKTASSATPDRFIINNAEFLESLRLYIRECAWELHNLCNGSPYIFFDISASGAISSAPSSAATMNSCFQSILQHLGIFEGETLYGFCVGNSIAAAIDTDDIAMVQSAGGWRSHDSALRYSKFAVVAAAALADNAPVDSTRAWLLSRNEFSVFS